MQRDGLAEIVDRLERLEAASRRWRVLALSALSVVSLLLLTAAASSQVADELRTRQVVIVSADGSMRAILDATGLYLLGAEGRVRGRFVHFGTHGWIDLADEDGKPRMRLNVYPKLVTPSPSMVFYDSHSKERVKLALEQGAPSLTLLDSAEVPRSVLGYAILEAPRTGVKEQHPESLLLLLGNDGRPIWKAP